MKFNRSVFTIGSFVVFLTGNIFPAKAQSLHVGTPLLEETARRLQVTGRSTDYRSFMIRPLYAATDQSFDALLFPKLDSTGQQSQASRPLSWKKGGITLLPASLRQQFNAHHPYGWNDGAMIPAKGYQALASAGVHARFGILSVQLQPEVVVAANPAFSPFPKSYSDSIWYHYYTVLDRVDAPERFGNGTYSKILPGQSSIRLNIKKLSLGLSSQNLWWGPGQRNSLLMSNTAPGFPHLTFNTTAPVQTRIGSFEWQVVAGRLRGSGILPKDTSRRINDSLLYTPKKNADRYLNALVVNWQPKWIKGLYLGFSRAFYQYENMVPSSLDGYLPVLGAFYKKNAQNDFFLERDQLLALSFRLLLPESKAEFYGEYGRNDHSMNFRDLLLEPEHSRAYLLGARKYFQSSKGRELSLFFELTQLQRTNTILLREQESWYTHYQVRHGYTHLGQVIGAGIGPGGSNSQTIGIDWYKGINKTRLTLERVVRDNDFYYNAFTGNRNFHRHWVDLSLNFNRSWQHKRFIFSGIASLVRSYNYQWRTVRMNEGKRDVTNLHASFSVSYLF